MPSRVKKEGSRLDDFVKNSAQNEEQLAENYCPSFWFLWYFIF